MKKENELATFILNMILKQGRKNMNIMLNLIKKIKLLGGCLPITMKMETKRVPMNTATPIMTMEN